jgi:hypothetical protein
MYFVIALHAEALIQVGWMVRYDQDKASMRYDQRRSDINLITLFLTLTTSESKNPEHSNAHPAATPC